jgi:DNA-binding MarR family transcriptional regulator
MRLREARPALGKRKRRRATSAAALPTEAECIEIRRACVCFQLRRAARSITHIYDARFAEAGVTSTQFSHLVALSALGPLSVGALAERLATDPSTTSRNVAALERRGLLRAATPRSRAGDKRERLVELTPAGRVALGSAYPRWREAQREIEVGLSEEERAAVFGFLRRMSSRRS